MMPALNLNLVCLTLCDACLDGIGGECHTPGCALWINTAPDVSIRERALLETAWVHKQDTGCLA